MDALQSHRVEMLSIAVALVAIGAGTAYYFYVTRTKKPKASMNFSVIKMIKVISLIVSMCITGVVGAWILKTSKNLNLLNVSNSVIMLLSSHLPFRHQPSVLGLPIGQHMSCRGKDNLGEEVIKAYTPTTLDSDLGHFELVIKMYPQGRMSHHFREMCEGDYLAVKGPKVKIFDLSYTTYLSRYFPPF
ncbi:hypothetical protein Patl1_30143 [Pistacia atlantica]|uniref:Uncharacterized protein n=1 Tax=Pistacia atlantica TaxID=434234 RepID=A0ACC1A9G5_9ROSI|nr:hypothetical protein Patl1_30143 [Pistacia atlantica]